MRAKLTKENLLVLTATNKKDRQFLKDAFDDLSLGRKKLAAAGTHLGLKLTLRMQEEEKK